MSTLDADRHGLILSRAQDAQLSQLVVEIHVDQHDIELVRGFVALVIGIGFRWEGASQSETFGLLVARRGCREW
jgi:hypothetical protein